MPYLILSASFKKKTHLLLDVPLIQLPQCRAGLMISRDWSRDTVYCMHSGNQTKRNLHSTNFFKLKIMFYHIKINSVLTTT